MDSSYQMNTHRYRQKDVYHDDPILLLRVELNIVRRMARRPSRLNLPLAEYLRNKTEEIWAFFMYENTPIL